MSIRQISSRLVYRNQWMTLREDVVERDNGTRGIYGVVEKCDSAIVIPIQGEDVFLVEQFRYPVGEYSLEFPQGSWDADGYDPLEIARGELKEETGLEAESMQHLGEIAIAIGYAKQKTHAFLATGLTPGKSEPDAEEHDLKLHKLPISQLELLVRENRIKDAQSLAAWALFKAHRNFA